VADSGDKPAILAGLVAAPVPEAALDALADGCIGISEAMRFSGLSRSTLYAAMEAGELPFVKIGRRRLLPRQSLVQWLARGWRGGQ